MSAPRTEHTPVMQPGETGLLVSDLIRERDALKAEVTGLTHERDVARQACVNVTAMRDSLRERNAALLAALEACDAHFAALRQTRVLDTAEIACRTKARAAIALARGGK